MLRVLPPWLTGEQDQRPERQRQAPTKPAREKKKAKTVGTRLASWLNDLA